MFPFFQDHHQTLISYINLKSVCIDPILAFISFDVNGLFKNCPNEETFIK